jgi:hypothetical protein
MILLTNLPVLIAGHISGTFSGFLSNLSIALQAGDPFSDLGLGLALAFALGASMNGNIPAEALANIRRWHGSIDEQFSNISNVADTLAAHLTDWNVPKELAQQLLDDRDRLSALITKCRTNNGSTADRMMRNSLLKALVAQCLTQIKSWAFMQHYDGVLTADDVHLLGFFLPGDAAAHRERKDPTDELTDVKVAIINADNIRVIIDQAETESASHVRHGWPHGVRQALIVILAADGHTEVHREMTTRQHTDIRMPEGSHGKLFIIKAAFLTHVSDTPKFGNEPTFSMPLTTEDLAAALDRQHHEDFEAQIREVERHRQEVERLQNADDTPPAQSKK